jgi:hypothetical protein
MRRRMTSRTVRITSLNRVSGSAAFTTFMSGFS